MCIYIYTCICTHMILCMYMYDCMSASQIVKPGSIPWTHKPIHTYDQYQNAGQSIPEVYIYICTHLYYIHYIQLIVVGYQGLSHHRKTLSLVIQGTNLKTVVYRWSSTLWSPDFATNNLGCWSWRVSSDRQMKAPIIGVQKTLIPSPRIVMSWNQQVKSVGHGCHPGPQLEIFVYINYWDVFFCTTCVVPSWAVFKTSVGWWL